MAEQESDFEQQLMKLARLRDAKVITEAEFNEKKKAILERLDDTSVSISSDGVSRVSEGLEEISTKSTVPKSGSQQIGIVPGCLMIAVGSILVILIVAQINQKLSWSGLFQQVIPTGNHQSKADWKAKFYAHFPNFGNNQMVTLGQLKAFAGEPSSSQTMGNVTYLYYECADGMVQVISDNPALFGNMAGIKQLNDY